MSSKKYNMMYLFCLAAQDIVVMWTNETGFSIRQLAILSTMCQQIYPQARAGGPRWANGVPQETLDDQKAFVGDPVNLYPGLLTEPDVDAGKASGGAGEIP